MLTAQLPATPMPTVHPPGFEKKPQYCIPRKNTEQLFEFDGDVTQYRLWKIMIDHITEQWTHWKDTVAQCERFQHPISCHTVQCTSVCGCNGTELAPDLWSYLSRFLGKRFYS